MNLSFIAEEIHGTAFDQMEDADYENHGRIIIGNAMILVDKDEFEELRSDILSFTPEGDKEDFQDKFEDRVKIKED